MNDITRSRICDLLRIWFDKDPALLIDLYDNDPEKFDIVCKIWLDIPEEMSTLDFLEKCLESRGVLKLCFPDQDIIDACLALLEIDQTISTQLIDEFRDFLPTDMTPARVLAAIFHAYSLDGGSLIVAIGEYLAGLEDTKSLRNIARHLLKISAGMGINDNVLQTFLELVCPELLNDGRTNSNTHANTKQEYSPSNRTRTGKVAQPPVELFEQLPWLQELWQAMEQRELKFTDLYRALSMNATTNVIYQLLHEGRVPKNADKLLAITQYLLGKEMGADFCIKHQLYATTASTPD